MKVGWRATRYEVSAIVAGESAGCEITHIGGRSARGESWVLPISEAIAGVESGRWKFFVRHKGQEFPLHVAQSGALKTLMSDGEIQAILLALPRPDF